MKPGKYAPKVLTDQTIEGWQKCCLQVLDSSPISTDDEVIWHSTVELVTGRTHQIRAQVANLDLPIIGDRLYGSQYSRQNPLITAHEIGLRSFQLEFSHKGKFFSYTLPTLAESRFGGPPR
jgi:23S rRNA-/tRNA-specific pseudouridylate synthase